MNILVLSPIYPGPGVGQNFTKVVHYFTKEWIKMGEKVQVINLPSYFPHFMYYMPSWAKKIVNKKFGSALPDKRNKSIEIYDIDGIPVLRVPLFKLIPGIEISKKELKTAENEIVDYLIGVNFIPDVIVAHWTEPCLYFIDAFKNRFRCPSAVVTHVNQIHRYSQYINSVDLWGYRRLSCIRDFEKLYPQIHFKFRCYSGIPKVFLENIPKRDFNSIKRYVYVGMMLPRKHPDKVIEAIRIVHNKDTDYRLALLGDGSMLKSLRDKVLALNLNDKVVLPGRVDREKIISTLDSSDVFIMISEDEVFGLVYLEAMARGCIVIASKGEGMEGIIENGINGFLVEAGNVNELTCILSKIHQLSSNERSLISQNAIKTANDLTDEAVASYYLNNLNDLVNTKI